MPARPMTRTLLLPLALLVLGSVLIAQDTAPDDGPPLKWLTDLDAARAQAKAEKKPLLIVFR